MIFFLLALFVIPLFAIAALIESSSATIVLFWLFMLVAILTMISSMNRSHRR